MRLIRRLFALVFILFVLVIAGTFHLLAGGSMGAGDIAGTLESGGRTRDYFIHAPQGYDGKTPLPVVFVLHGATQSAASAERMSGISASPTGTNF